MGGATMNGSCSDLEGLMVGGDWIIYVPGALDSLMESYDLRPRDPSAILFSHNHQDVAYANNAIE